MHRSRAPDLLPVEQQHQALRYRLSCGVDHLSLLLCQSEAQMLTVQSPSKLWRFAAHLIEELSRDE